MKSVHILSSAAVLCAVIAASCSDRERDFDACGQVNATEVVVSAESSGRIISLGIEEGDRIARGECVGAIDSLQTYLLMRELEERKRNAASRLVDIDRQLAAQTARLATLEKDLDRYKSLLEKDAGTAKQVDDTESQIAVTRREMAAQKQTYERNNEGVAGEMDIYDVQIAQKRDQLDKCRIVSPVGGTVLVQYAEEGETVTSGKPLFKVADMDDVYVKAYFTTAQLSQVRLGDVVKVVAEDGTDNPRQYEGKVTWISEEAEFTPKNIQTKDERADLVYAVKVSVRNDGFLKLGMYAYVTLK